MAAPQRTLKCQENSHKSSFPSPKKPMVSPSADCGVASSFAEVEHLSLAMIWQQQMNQSGKSRAVKFLTEEHQGHFFHD
jgi:hypothetical protein